MAVTAIQGCFSFWRLGKLQPQYLPNTRTCQLSFCYLHLNIDVYRHGVNTLRRQGGQALVAGWLN